MRTSNEERNVPNIIISASTEWIIFNEYFQKILEVSLVDFKNSCRSLIHFAYLIIDCSKNESKVIFNLSLPLEWAPSYWFWSKIFLLWRYRSLEICFDLQFSQIGNESFWLKRNVFPFQRLLMDWKKWIISRCRRFSFLFVFFDVKM